MGTGENEQGLRKIMDLTRMISVAILLMHFYYHCHDAVREWGYTLELIDRIVLSFVKTGLFETIYHSKVISIGFLIISLIGAQGRKDERINVTAAFVYVAIGLFLVLLGHFIIFIQAFFPIRAQVYIVITMVGYIMILTGGTWLSRLIKLKLTSDVFNRLNESFPQEERFIDNEFSINLPAAYNLKGKRRRSWINVINPFRSLLVIGTPGAGKSYFVIRHIITQHIKKGFTMFLYDFKFDDLSIIAYNSLLKYRNYKKTPSFYVINFDQIYHRCNPLDPNTMDDITDATESSRTIMLGLNRDWVRKQGDFFVESPINFLTGVIWFLRKYNDGIFCTLPHVIELMQMDYKTLFPLLRTEPEIDALIDPFESAFRNQAMEQLEGQIASAKIGMARLSSPQLYYVLSGNDFTLDINNPDDPKIVCAANNPQKQQIYGAVLSLYVSRVVRLVNKKHKLKSSLIFDEFPSLYCNGIDSLVAQARSNLVAPIFAIQDYSQLKKDYGRDQAEVIMNLAGNVISGQVVGDTAKILSERFGKIVQERGSVSVNRSDSTVSRSTQLDAAIPPSKIATLSSGEFVGAVADNPDQKIDQKVFHAEILNDHAALKAEEESYKPIPMVRKVTSFEIEQNYFKIKDDIIKIINDRLKTAA
ncbi:MAG TPA: conjugal transfer protein MobC [Ohtaekwangia sp.]|nr:conjugal transfer protein MobC [Ohtaekwangia sp.]